MSEGQMIQATGELPLKFTGEVLHESIGGTGQNRYYQITIFLSDGDFPFICSVNYVTHWQRESPHTEVWEEESLADVFDRLRSFDPTKYVVGFPPGKHFEQRQARLMEEIATNYRNQITELFTEAGQVKTRRSKADPVPRMCPTLPSDTLDVLLSLKFKAQDIIKAIDELTEDIEEA